MPAHMYDRALRDMLALDQPNDCYFIPYQGEGKVYVTNPPLAWQRGDYSDIVGKEMHYPWIQTNDQ
jgi:hypothetical protein